MGILIFICPSCKQENSLSSTKCCKCGAIFSSEGNLQGKGFVIKRVNPEMSWTKSDYLSGSTVFIIFAWVFWVLSYFIFLFPLIPNSLFGAVAQSFPLWFHLFSTLIVPWGFVIIVSKIKKNMSQKQKMSKK